jgi:tRNA 2-thiouridine synthesizing protein B
MILHKISSSPFHHQALQHCLQRIHSSDGLLLTQDAVYAVMHQTLRSKLETLDAVYMLKEDADARGVQIKSEQIQLISYGEFVELSLKFEQVMSWQG